MSTESPEIQRARQDVADRQEEHDRTAKVLDALSKKLAAAQERLAALLEEVRK